MGEGPGEGCHQAAEKNAGDDGDGNELPVAVPHLRFGVTRSQHLAHEDAYGVAHGHEHHAGKVAKGGGDVHGRHHIQTAGGVALVQNGHAGGPQKLVHQQGHTLHGDQLEELAGDVGGAVDPHDIGAAMGVAVGPNCHNSQLHIPGDHRGQRRAGDAQSRSAEVAEDQHIVQAQVHQHGGDACQHGNHGVAALLQGAGVGVGNCEGQEAPEHDLQVLHTIGHGACGKGGISLASEVQPDQGLSARQENAPACRRQQQGHQSFVPEGVAHALGIHGAVELGGEDACAGAGPEDAQVEYENQTVDDGHAAHGNGAHLTHHDVIQQRDEVGDAVLDDDGQCDGKHPAVKRPGADEFFEHNYL